MRDRSTTISKLKQSRSFRASYIAAKLKVLIPAQLRALRLKSETNRQEDLALAAEMRQSRISAMETPGAVNFNLDTLVRVASALKVGLVVKFVPFSEMLRWENEFSQDSFNPVTIDRDSDFQGRNAPVTQFYQLGSARFLEGTYRHSQRGSVGAVGDYIPGYSPNILRPSETSGMNVDPRPLGGLGSAAMSIKQ